MTLAAAADVLWPAPFDASISGNMLIDAANEKAAHIFQIPADGSIDRVWFSTNTVTTGDTVDVRLESLDASGDPSGTLIGTNTNASQAILATDDNLGFEVTLTAAATVTKGQWVALVVALSGSPTGVINIRRRSSTPPLLIAYADLYTGTWAKNFGTPLAAVRYNTGTWATIPSLVPWVTAVSTSFSDSSNPDERGNKLVLPFGCKVTGFWYRTATSLLGDFTLKLYDNSDNLLADIAIDGDVGGATGNTLVFAFDDAAVTLTPGTYRITKRATTATLTNLAGGTVPTGYGATLPGGGAVTRTSRNNNGAWTDVANEIECIGLVISALDDAAGGGGARAYGFVG